MGSTYKSPSIMASNGHKELKMVQNDIKDNCLFVYVQIFFFHFFCPQASPKDE